MNERLEYAARLMATDMALDEQVRAIWGRIADKVQARQERLTMNKKHFVQIAGIFANKLSHAYEQNPVRNAALFDVANAMCKTFKDCNPAFDKDRFLDACGFTADRGFDR